MVRFMDHTAGSVYLSACGTGVSKKVIRPVQVPQGVPVAGVTDLAARSLGSLNYRVVEMDPAVGRIGAERSVPGDMYNRVTRMKIDVAPGNAGETLLNIEASTCSGMCSRGNLRSLVHD